MSRRKLINFASILILGLPLALAQNPANADKNTRILALGDSLAFGDSPLLLPGSPTFPGYPDLVGKVIHRNVANASCPGETSGSLLASGVPDLGCQAWRATQPLLVPYTGTQLDFAVPSLRPHPQ